MGEMKSGVAKSIREKYTEVYDEYKQKVDERLVGEDSRMYLLGDLQLVNVGEKMVANLFGQYKYGYGERQYTNTTSLYAGLKKLRIVAEYNDMSVALPYKIGSFRGGANWNEVEELILTAFDGYEVALYKLG